MRAIVQNNRERHKSYAAEKRPTLENSAVSKQTPVGSHTMAKRRICYFGGTFDPPTYGHMFSAAAVLDSGAVDEVWISPCGGDPVPRAPPFLPRARERLNAEAHESSLGPSEAWREGAAAKERPTPTSPGKHSVADGSERVQTQDNGWCADQASAQATACGDAPEQPSRMPGERRDASGAATVKNRPDKAMKTPAALRLQMTHLAVAHFFGAAETRRSPVRVLEWEALTPGFTPTFKVLKQLGEENPDCEFSILIGDDILPNLPTWYNASALMDEYAFLIIPRSGTAHHMAMLLSSAEGPLPAATSTGVQIPGSVPVSGDSTPSARAPGAPPDASSREVGPRATEENAPRAAPCAACASSETAAHASPGHGGCETPLRCVTCIRAAAATAEQKLREGVEKTLKITKRASYIDQLCMQSGRPYFAWPASSSYVRRILSRRLRSPQDVVHCSTLMSPALYSFIDQHGLYVSE